METNEDAFNDGFIDDTFDDIKPIETTGELVMIIRL